MRLIDEEKLMEDIQKTITEKSSTIDWLNMIYRQPTAYDVDKVVEQLEEQKVKGIYDSSSIIGEKNVWAKAIEIVKQEAEQYELYDTILIHTNGLEEGIRCAVCTNQIKSDIGCDGGCCVDENLVKRICDVIHKLECKPYQQNGE